MNADLAPPPARESIGSASTTERRETVALPAPRRSAENQRTIRIGIRYEVLRRDRFRCVLCGASPAIDVTCRLQVDHIVAVAHGGKSAIENLRSTCQACNLGKGAKVE